MKLAAQLLKYLPLKRAATARPTAREAMPAPLMLALEPRIVYDASAAAIGTAAGGAAAPQHHPDTDAHATDAAAPRPAAAQSDAAATGGSASAQAQAQPRATHGFTEASVAPAEKQVVFIDPSVANYQQLLAGLPAGTQYVILNSTGDGLGQIAQYLQQHPGVDAIHLVSHGMNGAVQVGATWLTAGDISAYSGELAQIGAAMKPGGDFLIYGCDVAENADGKALVQQIASASHLNVAASTDVTGAAALGGNWTLEYDAGAVHTPVIFSAAAEQQFSGELGVTVETYDGQVGYDTPGGATGVSSFTLDGITYTFDHATEVAVDSTSVNQFGPPPLSDGPSDGVLFGNVQGNLLTSMTMSLQNGDKMAVQSFDIDINSPSIVTVQGLDALGNVIGTITLDTDQNGGSSSFHVDLSTNPAFAGVKALKFFEADNASTGAFLTPTLDNFTYVDLSSPPAMTATGGSTSFVEADNVASTPVTVDSGMTLVDGDATTAKQATVAITGNFASGQDVLGFTNTSAALYGDISAAYNATSGVMTLTSSSGTATITQWQAALRAVTYTDTAAAPSTATRTLSFTLTSDAFGSPSNTVTKNVTVTATDQTPIVSTSGSTAIYQSGAAPATIDTHVSVSDTNNATQSSAIVSISGGFHSGDSLAFANDGSTMGNISASYNSGTGVMTLTSSGATATDAQWASALSAIQFSSASTSYGNRTISFATNDGTKTSAAATDTINVTNPVLVTTDTGSASFVAADNSTSTPVAIDPGLTISDSVATTLATATVAITNFQSGEDVLSFANDGSTMGNITASFNSGTGMLTLTSAGATATVAQWQSALRSVAYTDGLVTPNPATRTVSFTVADGSGHMSDPATRTVTVTATDQTPIVTAPASATNYVGGASAVTIDSGITVSDLDNSTQSSATVAIIGNFHSGDSLGFTNSNAALFGNISAVYNSLTGTMTLTSSGASATDAQWTNALSAVTFFSLSTTYSDRTISFSTSDGVKTSAGATDTIHMTAPPQITTDAGSALFVSGDNTASTPIVIDGGLTVTDGSSTALTSVTVSITAGLHSSEDVLAFGNDGATMGNITGSYDGATGVLTLQSAGSSATLAQWQSALQSVTYNDTSSSPDTTTRTISYVAVDGAGNTSATATRTIAITATDQTPILTAPVDTTSYLGGSAAVIIDSGVTVSDLNNPTQSSATVSIGSGFGSGDTLTFVNTDSSTFGNIAGSYNSATGVLTLTSLGATASNGQWSHALSAVTFSSSSTTYGSRTIAFSVSDGTKTSSIATDTVAVLGPPQITTGAGSTSFVSGDNTASTPVVIDSGLTLTDGVTGHFSSATVAITGGLHSGEDMLSFVNDGSTMGNIAASYDTSTGILTLTSQGGSATTAEWQSALASVKYTDTAVSPDTTTRTISFSATDDASNTSNTATHTVTMTATDQTPIVTTSPGTKNYLGGAPAVTIDSGVGVTDRDNATQSSATVSIGAGFASGDVLAFNNTNSATFGNIAGSYDAATGVLTLTSSGATATNGEWSNALSAVTFSSTSTTYGNRTISIAVNDSSKVSVIATDTVDVLGPPQITTDAGSAPFIQADNVPSTPVVVDAGLTLTDGATTTFATATVSITGNFASGEDVLSFTNDGSTMGNIVASYDAGTGILALTSAGATATIAEWQSALASVKYTDTAASPNTATRTVTFEAVDGAGNTSNSSIRTVSVTATDQTPIVSTTTGGTDYRSGTNATTIDSAIRVSDLNDNTQSSATVSVGSGFHSGDTLGFSNTSTPTFGNITASFDASTGVLTLTSAGATATDAQWANALSAVTFSTTSTAYGNRSIAFVTNDGTKSSAPVTDIVHVTNAIALSPDSGSASFVQGDNAQSKPVIVGPDLTLTDTNPSATQPATATIAITGNFHSGEDVLIFTNSSRTAFGDITGSYDASAGVLTLTSSSGAATLAQWQNALAAVAYTDTALHPDASTRTVSFTVTDNHGFATSAATRSVSIAATDQAPVLTTTGTTTSYRAGATPTAIDTGIMVRDLNDNTQLSATVSIGAGFQSGDTLGFSNTSAASFGNIAASYDAATGALTLTSAGATATDAQWSNALSAVTFSSTSQASGGRTIVFAINDGQKTSAPASATLQLVAAAPAGSRGIINSAPERPPQAPPSTSVNPLGDAVSNTPSVLTELLDPLPVGAIPSIPTSTFSDPNPHHAYLPGRTSVPPGAALVPAELSAPSYSPFDAVPTVAAPITVSVDMSGTAGSGRFTVDISNLDGAGFADSTEVDVSLAGGKALPSWLRYDAAKGTLSGEMPRSAHDVHVLVQVRDASGHVVRREIVLAPNAGAVGTSHMTAPHAALAPMHEPMHDAAHQVVREASQTKPLPSGKPSLAQQFAQARAALHIARPAPAGAHAAHAVAATNETGSRA